MVYLAHVSPEDGREQSILDHLTNTAALAGDFAKIFAAKDAGYLCGLLHDIGKYSDKFQRRIRNSGEKVDHSTAGAQVAYKESGNVPVAFCIAGHHGGLPDGGNFKFDIADDATFFGKMRREIGRDIEDFSLYTTELTYTGAKIPDAFKADMTSGFFFIRMLYSCLVDADYLDTEAFMSHGRVQRHIGNTLKELIKRLNNYIAPWWDSTKQINQKRCEILKTVRNAGAQEKGMFSLTVPTGGGKTISSMAFALNHAAFNNLRRIIYIIPYTSIIEQAQKVFEDVFSEDNVIAHYASLDYATDENGNVTDKRYLATENWDAPIIVTTAVQFFESLYANRSSRCRKLHNIADSVLIFDEAQMLPVPYLAPCISAIGQLVKNYGCSAVLCTATQPALNPLIGKHLPGFQVRELCPDVGGMYDYFRRVRYEPLGLLWDDELVQRLSNDEQVLCIVNNRKQAQQLYHLLPSHGSFHLSTTMYPAHRRAVLQNIKDRLAMGQPCRVISTSLVEAGVDVDLPTVYRAMAGLDSIIQAGGRCNREGKRALKDSVVYIFDTDQRPPRNLLQNISAAQRTMSMHDDIASPEAIADYFDFLYYNLKDETELDRKQILKRIQSGVMPFASIAEDFRIIDDASYTVYIPIGEGERLCKRLIEVGPNRGLLRRLGQYAVGVYPQYFESLLLSGAVKSVSKNAAVLSDASLYSANTGLSFEAQTGRELIH